MSSGAENKPKSSPFHRYAGQNECIIRASLGFAKCGTRGYDQASPLPRAFQFVQIDSYTAGRSSTIQFISNLLKIQFNLCNLLQSGWDSIFFSLEHHHWIIFLNLENRQKELFENGLIVFPRSMGCNSFFSKVIVDAVPPWHCINTHQNVPDQQIAKKSAFIKVLAFTENQLIKCILSVTLSCFSIPHGNMTGAVTFPLIAWLIDLVQLRLFLNNVG